MGMEATGMQKRLIVVGEIVATRYTYVWRRLRRTVWVTTSATSLNALLEHYWEQLGTVSLDLEYHSTSAEPAVVSLGLSPDVAVLWHRPKLEETRKTPPKLAQLLGSTHHPKIGFAIDNDVWRLAASMDLLGHTWPKALFDLQILYNVMGLTPAKTSISMVDAVNSVNSADNPFEKMQHSGNWGAKELSDDQVVYAAGDTFVAFEVVNHFRQKLAPPPPPTAAPAVPHPVGVRVREDKFARLMAGLKSALHASSQSLATSCPKMVCDVLQFLVHQIGEDKLPRPSKLRRYLRNCCPAISATGFSDTEKSTVADLVAEILLRAKWLVPVLGAPGASRSVMGAPVFGSRLAFNVRNPIFRYIASMAPPRDGW
jgi:hypothetical protein